MRITMANMSRIIYPGGLFLCTTRRSLVGQYVHINEDW